MSAYKVNIVATNPKHEEVKSSPVEALVDTGSELTWLPSKVGIRPRRSRNFHTAAKALITRKVSYAILAAEDFETTDEVVFAEPGDMTLLGVRTLGGFGVMADPLGHRLLATTTIAAAVLN